jgi:hypothetical protein
LKAETDAEALEFAFAFQQEVMCIGQRNFGKANAIARSKLRRDTKIHRNHVRYFRVTADRLAISQEQNRLSARRNLDCAGSHCFRNQIDPLRARRAASYFNWLGRPASSIGVAATVARLLLKGLPAFGGFGEIVFAFQFRTIKTHTHAIGVG